MLRIVLLAALGIVAAAWALAAHFGAKHPPMLVPVSPSAMPTYDPDAGELPAPDLEPTD
jgi:hypothetical protein